MNVVSLFSGIGGIELGLKKAGASPLLFCEIDPVARAILQKHFPKSDIHDDVRELRELPQCDVLTAGFPCQDLSQAGAKVGISGAKSGLVNHVFELIRKQHLTKRPEWLLIENVPYMLRLDRGHAMTVLTTELTNLGYKWAYRVVDARSFGLPQRRPRVILVAALAGDPRNVIFTDNFRVPDLDGKPSEVDFKARYGFYWTEGSRGVGWAREGVPPIKCGSTVGIASPPAVWVPQDDFFGTISIDDAERLQGFPAGWTEYPATVLNSRESLRWRLVGNAVSVKMAEWVGTRLLAQEVPEVGYSEFDRHKAWPDAAWGNGKSIMQASVSRWASNAKQKSLSTFLKSPLKPLSERATRGFLKRALVCTNVNYSEHFLSALIVHANNMGQ
jgi:DNA (cytosine-5)-methyltransferase 1